MDANPESTVHSMAAQRAILRYDSWCDGQHLLGQNQGSLHPKHIAFLHEYANENHTVTLRKVNAKMKAPCLDLIEHTFRDVLDSVYFSLLSRSKHN